MTANLQSILETASIQDLMDHLEDIPEHEVVMLLESQLIGHPSSKFSLLFLDFSEVMEFNQGILKLIRSDGSTSITECTDPWRSLQEFSDRNAGYKCGFLSYDLKNYRERLTSENPDPVGLPEMWMGAPGKVIRYQLSASLQADNLTSVNQGTGDSIQVTKIKDRNEYIDNIRKILGHIREGDVYEVNLSHQIRGIYDGTDLSLYRTMRDRGPVPFAAFMRLGEVSICCSSPERFLSRAGNFIISDPIKGTRGRGRDAAEDRKILNELQNSEKDRSENLMIVDLVRNDFGRVCVPGSVNVESMFEIQSFGTVHQMVSRVTGVLDPDLTGAEALAACFPMGSMTGAPKIRSMEIIEELEDYRRGLYSGAIGFIEPNGDFSFNVVIRSAILKGKELFYSTGGAITSDSDPDLEWMETLIKARALGIEL